MSLDIAREIVDRRRSGGNRIIWSPASLRALAALGEDSAKDIVVRRALSAPALPAAPLAEPDQSRQYTFTISTGSVDRMGDVIDPLGWQLSAYRSNPIVLWAHEGKQIPVGRAVATWTASGRLKSTVQLAPADLNPAAEQVRGMIAGGYLFACSVGFAPLQFRLSTASDRPLGIDFLQQELLEWSICGVPANRDCLIDRPVGQGQGPAANQPMREQANEHTRLKRAQAALARMRLDLKR